MTFRAFISFDIGRSESLVALIRDIERARAQIKTVDPDLIHVTVKFLGEIEDSAAPDIANCMREATRGQGPFKVKLRRVGAFPSPSNPRVVWVGMEGAEPMSAISSRLEGCLEALGFPKEQRGFTAHVTVGRMKGPKGMASIKDIILANQDKEFGEVDFKSIMLKKSVLSPKGPSYSTVEEVSLSG